MVNEIEKKDLNILINIKPEDNREESGYLAEESTDANNESLVANQTVSFGQETLVSSEKSEDATDLYYQVNYRSKISNRKIVDDKLAQVLKEEQKVLEKKLRRKKELLAALQGQLARLEAANVITATDYKNITGLRDRIKSEQAALAKLEGQVILPGEA